MKITKDRCRYFYGECHVVTGKKGEVVAMFRDAKDAENFKDQKVKYRMVREAKI